AWLATGVEGDQQRTAGAHRAVKLSEHRRQLRGGHIADRIDSSDTGPTGVRDRQRLHRGLDEGHAGMRASGKLQHAWRDVDAARADAKIVQEPRHLAGTAADVGDRHSLIVLAGLY